MRHLIYLVALVSAIEGFQSVQLGIIRCMGFQSVGLILNLIAYCMISVPVGIVLCYGLGPAEEYGIRGLYLGYVCGISCLSVTLFIFIECTDFKK